MAMVGFSFTKISAERKPVNNTAVNIESNAGVTTVTEMPVIDAKKSLLKFEFSFAVKYEPGVGKIEIDGEAVYLYDKDFGSKVLEHWTKEKKLPAEVMPEVFNNLLARSNMEAIIISRDMGLPSPIQMPRVDIKPIDKSKAEKSEAKESKTESKESKSEKGKK
jgi:hypothetical protein